MSDGEAARAIAVCEQTLRAIDASLGTLVVARDSIVSALTELRDRPAPDPEATMGAVTDPATCGHRNLMDLPGGRGQLCEDCGAQVDA